LPGKIYFSQKLYRIITYFYSFFFADQSRPTAEITLPFTIFLTTEHGFLVHWSIPINVIRSITMSEWTGVNRFTVDNDADSFTRISGEIEHEIQDTVEQDITQPLIEFFSKRVVLTPVPQTLAEIISLSSHGSLSHVHWPLAPRFATSEVKREQTNRQLRTVAEFALRIQRCDKRRHLTRQQEGALTPVAYLAQISHAIIDTLCKPQPLHATRTAIRGQLKQLLFNMQRKLHRRIVNLQRLTYLQQQALQTEGQPGLANQASHDRHGSLSEYEQLLQLEKKLLAQIKTVSEQYRQTALRPVINCIKRYVVPIHLSVHNPATCGMFSQKIKPAPTLTGLLTEMNPPYGRSRTAQCSAAHQTLVGTRLTPVERRLARPDTGPDGALTVATISNIAKTLRMTLAGSRAIDRQQQEKRRYQTNPLGEGQTPSSQKRRYHNPLGEGQTPLSQKHRYHNPLGEGLTPPSPMTRAIHKSLKRATAARGELESLYAQLAATRQALREKQPSTATTSVRSALH
jgi:hypothetical protein